mmetsp:Transcript_14367/g.30142  ORF Transcript_14367/g.30142 Transcript_14367/m.30142 type:complete len:207 (+) Transcript_14367:26-646(+)
MPCTKHPRIARPLSPGHTPRRRIPRQARRSTHARSFLRTLGGRLLGRRAVLLGLHHVWGRVVAHAADVGPELPDGGKHLPLRRAADRVLPLHAGAIVLEHDEDVLFEELVDVLELLQRQVREGDALVLGQLDCRARDVVCLAEGHALAHKVLGEVGREHLGHELRGQRLRARHHRDHDTGRDLQARGNRVDSVEERLLVFLQVLVI